MSTSTMANKDSLGNICEMSRESLVYSNPTCEGCMPHTLYFSFSLLISLGVLVNWWTMRERRTNPNNYCI